MKIEIQDLVKNFKNEDIICNLNYTFKKGNIYGVVGRNGCGKSVLLKMISGLYKPTSGSILFDGINYIAQEEFPKNMGVAIERPMFIDDLTGKENLLLISKIRNIIDEDQINKYLELVNLKSDGDKKYAKYSMGMRQKLAIIQAIMENQGIILFDEPFNGIERDSVTKIKEYLTKIKKDSIIIITTHIKEDIENLADVILEMQDGKFVEENSYGKRN